MPERPRRIATKRLVLEATVPEHAEGLFAATEASVAELKPWLAWAVKPTIEQSLAFTRTTEESWRTDRAWPFTISWDDEIVGHIELRRLSAVFNNGEIGYWIRSDVAGRGLITEAASAVIRFGFETIGLHRIELHAGVENHGSIAVAERLGFQREGIARDGSRGARGYYDVYVYGLLEDDERNEFD